MIWLHVTTIFMSVGLLLTWWTICRLCRLVEDMCERIEVLNRLAALLDTRLRRDEDR